MLKVHCALGRKSSSGLAERTSSSHTTLMVQGAPACQDSTWLKCTAPPSFCDSQSPGQSLAPAVLGIYLRLQGKKRKSLLHLPSVPEILEPKNELLIAVTDHLWPETRADIRPLKATSTNAPF